METVSFGKLHEIRTSVHVGLRKILLIYKVLPLPYHAQGLVVEYKGDHRQPVMLHCCELVAVHAEASVTRNVDHHLVRIAHLCSDGSAKSEAHGSETAAR